MIGLALLIITIVGSMLYDRFFCKYLCPMGAMYGIISKVSPLKITRNEDKCISCGICNKNCPMNIDIANTKQITSTECINCQICVLSCPNDSCLQIKHGKKNTNPILATSMIFMISLEAYL